MMWRLRVILAGFAIMALAGCASLAQPHDATLDQRVAALHSDFEWAKVAADLYAALPACGNTVSSVCSSPNLVAITRAALSAAQVALDGLDAVLEDTGSTPKQLADALQAAAGAVLAFQTAAVPSRAAETLGNGGSGATPATNPPPS